MSNYAAKLRDARWQRVADNVRSLAGYQCDDCGDKIRNLQAHHKVYESGKEPWDYPITNFKCLCSHCHKETEDALHNLREMAGMLSWWEINSLVNDFGNALKCGRTKNELLWLIRMALTDADRFYSVINTAGFVGYKKKAE